jgi:hypothetical protein
MKRSSVVLNPAKREYNPRYTNETGKTRYPMYAGGSGYVLSYAVVARLSVMRITDSSALPFRHFPREDATIGTWIQGLGPGKVGYVRSERKYVLAHPRADLKKVAGTFNKQLLKRTEDLNVRGERYLPKTSIDVSLEQRPTCYHVPRCDTRLVCGRE